MFHLRIMQITAFICLLSCSLLSGDLQKIKKVNGVWFTESDDEKIITIFADIDGLQDGQATLLYDKGRFDTFSYSLRKGKLTFTRNSKSFDLHFFGEDIMLFNYDEPPHTLVFKRIKDLSLLNEIDTLTGRYQLDLVKQNLNRELRQALKQEIEKTISWDLLKISPGEYLGWLKKKEKIAWEKKMRQSGKAMKFHIDQWEDTDSLSLIKGKWLFNGKHTYIFTDSFVCESLGVKLYRLRMVNRPGYKDWDVTYTILIHKEDNHSYLHIVHWQFEFQPPTRIGFQGTDKLVTFDENLIDGHAVRKNE